MTSASSPATPIPPATSPTAPATWASATSPARSSRRSRPSYRTRTSRAREFVVDCRAERILVEGGRAAGVVGSYADADGGQARVTVQGAAGRGRLRLDGVAGAAAALRHRRAGDRRVPAPASLDGDDRRLRRGAARLVGPAAGRALGRVRQHRRRLRLPARVPGRRRRRRRPRRRPGTPAASTSSRCRSSATPPR